MPVSPAKRLRRAGAADAAGGAPICASVARCANAGSGSVANSGMAGGSEVFAVGSICSGIGVCHRAAALLNSCNVKLSLRDAFACEVARPARLVLAADFPGLRFFGDVCQDGVRLPPCDILVAGFPRQPFSPANRKRKGSSD